MRESGSTFLISRNNDCSKCLGQNVFDKSDEVREVLSHELWGCLSLRLSLKTQQYSKPLEFREKSFAKYFDLIVMEFHRSSPQTFH